MNQLGKIFDTVRAGDKTVNFLVREGEVLESRTHAGKDFSTSRRGKQITIHTHDYEATAIWVRWENGEEEELQSFRGAVTGLKGHKLRVIAAEHNGQWINDIVRINKSTSRWSGQLENSKLAVGIAKQLLGLSYWAVLPMILAIVAGMGVIQVTSNVPLGLGGFVLSWIGFHVALNKPFNAAKKQLEKRLPSLINTANQADLSST